MSHCFLVGTPEYDRILLLLRDIRGMKQLVDEDTRNVDNIISAVERVGVCWKASNVHVLIEWHRALDCAVARMFEHIPIIPHAHRTRSYVQTTPLPQILPTPGIVWTERALVIMSE